MAKPAWFGAGLLALLCLLAPGRALAQVETTLVAPHTSIQPGQSFEVAVRMQHRDGWHSFWKNAGTGLPTRIKWDLPEGWSAGEFRWPTPHLVRDRQGNITGHGYEGLLYLPLTVTPPADLRAGTPVELKGTVRWLMCETVCVPGKQDVSLVLPVSADAPQVDTDVRAGIASMSMPVPADGWTLAASEDKAANGHDTIVLHIAANTSISDPHFYPADTFIAYKQPQTVASRGNRALLKMAVDPEETRTPDAGLAGVLAYTDAQGQYRGVVVDVPFSSPAAAALAARTGDINAASAGADAAQAPALTFGVLLLALLGGLILNLMPCVFPVIGLKILGFVEQAGNNRRVVSAHALTFTLGVLLSFWALAGVLAVLRAGGEQLGWGFQLQSAPFVFGLTVLLLVFALNLSGVFEAGVRATSVGSNLHARGGLAGSFFAGMLATIVATPCSAPFLAPALGAALALPVAQSFVVFTAIALGLSLPYLVLSVFPRLVGLLPRPGAWMETFKQLMAFPLYATVCFLLWVLAGQLSEAALLNALLALSLVALAAWVYGRFSMPTRSVLHRRVASIAAAALLLTAVGWGWPKPPAPSAVNWEPWSVERVAELREQGRPIYVDFTARWCATCQVNKKVVFASPEVLAYVRDHDVATLKADWTNSDPLITAELARWERSAVPFNLAYPAAVAGTASAAEPVVLPEVLSPTIVLQAFNGAGSP
ncbi:protein-disulfide reductase DsbD family protein [Thermomonas sp.]